MQVASRILLVWGICDQFPSVPANSLFYSTMLIAWSATEVVRYSYFVFALNGAVPGVLAWLRYNLFFVAYPLGISSEVALVYLSIPEAKARDPLLEWVGYGILAVYIPGTSNISNATHLCVSTNLLLISHYRCIHPLYTHDDSAQESHARQGEGQVNAIDDLI